MAPLITHLVIAERIWPLLAGRWNGAYGSFLFGNLAADVDKFCPDLEQATTHLVGKDRTDAWLTQRSRRFIDQQAELLRAPFPELAPAEQAFVLGYLCHLTVDEATTSRFERFRTAYEQRAGSFPWNEAISTVVDETATGLLQDRSGMLAALESSRVPVGLFAFISDRCLQTMRWILFPLIREGGGFAAYIGLVRRNSLWHRHGQTSEEPVDEDLEDKLILYRQRLLDAETEARLVAEEFDIGAVVAASLDRCRKRLVEMIELA